MSYEMFARDHKNLYESAKENSPHFLVWKLGLAERSTVYGLFLAKV